MAEQTQETSTESLLDQLQNSKDSYVRGWAADLLGERAKDNEQVLGALRIVARSDKNASVRDAARKTLRKLGEKVEEAPEQMTGQTVAVGGFVGWFTLLIILTIVAYPSPPMSISGIISILGIPFGIAGAMAGKRWGKNLLSVFLGSVIATILGVGCLFFVLLGSGFLAQ